MVTRSDEQLVAAYREGEVDALRALIERYQEDLLRFLVRLTGDRQLAEDVFQEAFLQVHISADSFDVSRRFKPWLFTIAANKARDALRKKGRRHEVDLTGGRSGSAGGGDDGPMLVDLLQVKVPGSGAGQAMEDAERDAMVQRALDRLPQSLREIVLLAYFSRLSYAQIAEELGIPLGTVKSRLHSGVAAFARAWMQVSGGGSEGSNGR